MFYEMDTTTNTTISTPTTTEKPKKERHMTDVGVNIFDLLPEEDY